MNSLDTLLRLQHLLEFQDNIRGGEISLMFVPEAITLLKQAIQEVAQEKDDAEKRLQQARLHLEDVEEQEVIRHINSIPKSLKTRYTQRHVQ